MARALVITNPVATRTTPARTQAVSRVFKAAGWRVEVADTQAPGHARRLAERGVVDGMDVVVVFGGDGTTMQAAAALVGTDVPLGLVPGGTGNVLAGNLRIPSRPVPAAQMIARGRSRAIDLGRLERADGFHYFAVACGAGADAQVMGGTAHSEKQRYGMSAYWGTLFRVVPGIRSTTVAITVDGERIEMRAALTLVCNCREVIPPLLRVIDGVRIDDGVLDLLMLAADTPWQCARGMWRAVQNVVLGTGPTAYLQYARGRHITIVPEDVQPVQYDGDRAGSTPVVISVVPGAVRVMV